MFIQTLTVVLKQKYYLLMLKFIKDAEMNKAFIKDLEHSHLNLKKVDEATVAFINHILNTDNNLLQTRQCCKDPDILYYMSNF